MKIPHEYNIVNIMSQFKNDIKKKDIAFSLLLKLKQSIEFNATINWKHVFKSLGEIYNDERPFYNSPIYTPEILTKDTMPENSIFVFGSNTEGKHAGGAAKIAVSDFEAIMGQPRGLQGQSYGIVTIDYTKKEEVNLNTIKNEIIDLINFAIDNSHLTFYITKIGTGISGYTMNEIADLFSNMIIPSNVILPREFTVSTENYFYYEHLDKYYRLKSENIVILVDNKNSSISEIKLENARYNLPNEIVSITEEDFITATEIVLKKMF